jgi:cysteine synthase A
MGPGARAEGGDFTGISGGATFAVAVQAAEAAAEGSVVLCMLPDTGERYLTTPLFEGIVEDMDAEELRISKSTPGYQMP